MKHPIPVTLCTALLLAAALPAQELITPGGVEALPPGAGPAVSANPPAAPPALPQYETPRPVPARSIISPDLITGPGYKMDPMADPTGMLYSFKIQSDFGPLAPQSRQMLMIRLAEIRAMNRLSQLSKEDVFVRGMSQKLEDTAKATGKAIMSPVKTLKQVPVGFRKFADQIQAQEITGEVYGESGSQVYAQVKRDLCAKLGVDPYTDNQPLQQMLNDTARNENRGALVASIGTLVVGGGVGVAANLADMNADFNEIIRNKSASQLQVDNRAALQQIGYTQPQADYFLTTPGYTASNCTAITRALIALAKTRGILNYLENLPGFAGPESILYTQTSIQMAAQYARKFSGFSEVKFIGGTPLWISKDGSSAYLFAPMECLYWEREMDMGTANIRQQMGAIPIEYWIAGTASETAQARLAERGIIVKENAIDRLWAK